MHKAFKSIYRRRYRISKCIFMITYLFIETLFQNTTFMLVRCFLTVGDPSDHRNSRKLSSNNVLGTTAEPSSRVLPLRVFSFSLECVFNYESEQLICFTSHGQCT